MPSGQEMDQASSAAPAACPNEQKTREKETVTERKT